MKGVPKINITYKHNLYKKGNAGHSNKYSISFVVIRKKKEFVVNETALLCIAYFLNLEKHFISVHLVDKTKIKQGDLNDAREITYVRT